MINYISLEAAEKLHFSRIFLCLVSMQQYRLITAITASHLSDVGFGKTGFSKPSCSNFINCIKTVSFIRLMHSLLTKKFFKNDLYCYYTVLRKLTLCGI